MIDISLFVACDYCQVIQSKDFQFCSSCGKKNKTIHLSNIRNRGEEDKHIRNLLSYSIIGIVMAIIFFFIDSIFWNLLISTVLFAALDIIYAYKQPSVFSILLPQKVNFRLIISLIIVGIISGTVINFSIDYLNSFMSDYYDNNYSVYVENDYPFLLVVLATAVCPALFEELAFRGFVFNNFLKLKSKRAAILGSSFLFAIVHFSLISLFWIFPFGLLLAYLRSKHKTLFYGIILHFTHNFTVSFIEYYV